MQDNSACPGVFTLMGYSPIFPPRKRVRGISERTSRGLKSFRLKEEEEGQEEVDTSCSICLESMNKRQRVVKLACGHQYHDKCVRKWLKTSTCCPMCGYDLEPPARKTSSRRYRVLH